MNRRNWRQKYNLDEWWKSAIFIGVLIVILMVSRAGR